MKKIWSTNTGKVSLLFSIFSLCIITCYLGVELTSTPEFCQSCHEIQPSVVSWKHSTHGPTPDGVHPPKQPYATCRDCHLPSWSNPIAVIYVKTTHGARGLYQHWATPDKVTIPKLRAKANKAFHNGVCIQCHNNIDISKIPSYAQDIHSHLHHIPVSCTSCHRGVGHK